MLNFCISYFSLVHNYTQDWLKWIPRKFLKMINMGILDIYNDINVIKAICGSPTLPFKMAIRLVYAEGNVCKDTKNHELQN